MKKKIHLLDSDVDLTAATQVTSNCGKDFLAVKTVEVSPNDSICEKCLDARASIVDQKRRFTYAIVEDFPK